MPVANNYYYDGDISADNATEGDGEELTTTPFGRGDMEHDQWCGDSGKTVEAR